MKGKKQSIWENQKNHVWKILRIPRTLYWKKNNGKEIPQILELTSIYSLIYHNGLQSYPNQISASFKLIRLNPYSNKLEK